MSAQTSISKKETFKLFISFLKKEGAFLSFTYYLQVQRQGCKTLSYYLLKNTDTPFLLADAFKWHLTSQGFAYWKALNRKWINSLNSQS